MKIYLPMYLNDVIGDVYYTDKSEVEKLIKEAGDDYWCKELIDNADKPKVAKYQVYFYFGKRISNRFTTPDKIVEVETSDNKNEDEVIREALKVVGTYPKTYSTLVVRIG